MAIMTWRVAPPAKPAARKMLVVLTAVKAEVTAGEEAVVKMNDEWW